MIFTDASSAILLNRAGLFNTLTRAGDVVFASSVFHEVTRPGYTGARDFEQAVELKQVTVMNPADPGVPSACPEARTLDRGEKDTLCLFFEKQTGFILTDDGKAARLCDRNGFPFINALLVPKLFYFAGILDRPQRKKYMEALSRHGRYSDKILTIADSLTRKDLSLFTQGLHK